MELFDHGWAALKRMPRPVASYVVYSVLVSIVYVLCRHYLDERAEADFTPLMGILKVAFLVGLAAVSASLQAIYFSALAVEVDKPLWKCAGPADALRRFFMVWFLILLILYAVEQFTIMAMQRNDEQLVAALFPIFLFLYVLSIPVGACVMFWGRLQWSEFWEALLPMGRELSNVILVMFLLFVALLTQLIGPVLLSGLRISDSPVDPLNIAISSLFAAVASFMECLAFIVMIQICVIHRATDYDSDDFDF